MTFDGIINIATGLSASSKLWKNEKVQWSSLVDKLKTQHKTTETYEQFIRAPKDEQGKIKRCWRVCGWFSS